MAAMSAEHRPTWTVLVIGGGAAVGKTMTARAIGARYDVPVLPLDAVWLALKAVTSPASHPELHDPTDSELALPVEHLCERHIRTAEAISQALDPVIEHLLWEQQPVVVEGAWVTPAAARRWARRYDSLPAVFLHEPVVKEVLAAMLARSGQRRPTRKKSVLSEVCWLFGNWVREQAEAEGLPVVRARPHETLAERVLAAVELG